MFQLYLNHFWAQQQCPYRPNSWKMRRKAFPIETPTTKVFCRYWGPSLNSAPQFFPLLRSDLFVINTPIIEVSKHVTQQQLNFICIIIRSRFWFRTIIGLHKHCIFLSWVNSPRTVRITCLFVDLSIMNLMKFPFCLII